MNGYRPAGGNPGALAPTFNPVHVCELSTDHPTYRTPDYCGACHAWRVLNPPTKHEINRRHHAYSDVDFCTIVGCEVCP